jgi:hypothetical protein
MDAIAKSMAEGLGKIRCGSTTATVPHQCAPAVGVMVASVAAAEIASEPISSPAASTRRVGLQLSSSRTSPCHACAQVSEGRLLGGRTGRAFGSGLLWRHNIDRTARCRPGRSRHVGRWRLTTFRRNSRSSRNMVSDYLRSQVAVAGSDQPQVELDGAGTADPIDFALLEGARGSLAWRRCHAGQPPDPLARPDPSRCRRAGFAPPIPWSARAPSALRQGFAVAGRASESYALKDRLTRRPLPSAGTLVRRP